MLTCPNTVTPHLIIVHWILIHVANNYRAINRIVQNDADGLVLSTSVNTRLTEITVDNEGIV